jgi:hypothetical protein
VLTPAIVVLSLSFALVMGFVGGVLPAARAARLSIVDALRAAWCDRFGATLRSDCISPSRRSRA